MGKVNGSSSIEIEAPITAAFEAAADAEASPRWQPELSRSECLERDRDGNQVLVRLETDAKTRKFVSDVRVSYEKPHRMSWVQERGVFKSLEGSWEFEELDEGRTRATYWLEVDLGRMLGLLIRGPLAGALKNQVVSDMPKRLKRFIEEGQA